MGSFNNRCALSGLPVRSGDRIYYILLTQNDPEKIHHACYITDWWTPRNFPLRAEYDDYGGVTELEEGILQDSWMEGLREDLVETGRGDNEMRDLQVSRSMPLEEILKVLSRDELKVNRHVWGKPPGPARREPIFPDNCPDPKARMFEVLRLMESGRARIVGEEVHWFAPFVREPKPGVPNIPRITQLLDAAGLLSKDLLIDTPEHNIGRVRHSGYDTALVAAEKLQPLLAPLSEEYIAVITPGTGHYSKSAEIQLFPKLGGEEKSVGDRSFYRSRDTSILSHAMILEDVWMELLRYGEVNVKDVGRSATAFYVESLEFAVKKREIYRNEALWEEVFEYEHKREMNRDPFVRMLYSRNGSQVYSAMGWREHWDLLIKKALPVEEVQPLLSRMAETCVVDSVMDALGILWLPSTNTGTYWPEYQNIILFHKRLAEIMEEKRREDGGEDEDEEEATPDPS